MDGAQLSPELPLQWTTDDCLAAGSRVIERPGDDSSCAPPTPPGSSMRLSFSKPPIEFVCPISMAAMTDPVLSLNTGINYERKAFVAWRSVRGDVCPVTGNALGTLVPNQELKAQIEEWKQQIKGFRRIQRGSPTTYCITENCVRSAPSRSTFGSGKWHHVHETEHTTRRKEEMYKRIEHVLGTFTDAGLSDYMNRFQNDKVLPGGPWTSRDAQARLAEAMPTFVYDLEYSSIFRHGPTMRILSRLTDRGI
jgi:U-box domain